MVGVKVFIDKQRLFFEESTQNPDVMVDEEKFKEWKRVEGEWIDMQKELDSIWYGELEKVDGITSTE